MEENNKNCKKSDILNRLKSIYANQRNFTTFYLNIFLSMGSNSIKIFSYRIKLNVTIINFSIKTRHPILLLTICTFHKVNLMEKDLHEKLLKNAHQLFRNNNNDNNNNISLEYRIYLQMTNYIKA